MTHQNLGDEIFSAYASGTLSGPMRLLLETQSQLDPSVARQRDDAEMAAGLLLSVSEPAPLRASALSEIFAVVDAEAGGLGEAGASVSPSGRQSEKAARMASRGLDELLALPDAVRDLALEAGGNWQFAGPGVRVMELMREGEAKAELIRLEPGRGVPRHTHDCKEFTLVLCGAFDDGLARYGKGEMSIADPDIEHRPVAEAGEICIALAVTDGPLAFTGPLGWVQRALGGMN
ncbi:MAG: cupin domain-containing protein [Caulobacterales bacterium]|uniref:cupin domain-containing protein n=1 Tax=Glycocaulis sp. TaxID=1969725 RepID=UPI003F9F9780